MSHQVETMAFANETPWHGLGNPVDDTLSPEQMMTAAGCDWEVQLTQTHSPPNHAQHPGEPIDGSHFIERTLDGSILGEYGDGDYKPVKNIELFNFFEEFIDNGSMYLHTAGSLHNGRKVWCMATTKEAFSLGKDDEVVNNLLFTISHTGKHANSALQTPIRVVCANTMRLALSNGDDIVTHNHRAVFDPEALKVALGISSQQFGELEELAIAMAKRSLSGDEEIDYFRTVFGGREKVSDNGVITYSEGVRKAMAYFRGQEFKSLGDHKQETKNQIIARMREEIEALTSGKRVDEIQDELIEAASTEVNPGWDLPSARGTLWGAFNTVSYMTDHKPVRNFGIDHKLDSAFYGRPTNDPKTAAMEKAKELLTA